MKKQYNDRERYLKSIKTKKFLILSLQISILILFIALWEVLTYFEIADAFFFSSPSRIANLFIKMIKQDLISHVLITLYECLLSFLISTVLGYVISVILWWSDSIRKILEPYIIVLNSLPKIALGPLIIIWAGTGQKAIITMGILICIIVTIISILNGFVSADKEKEFLLISMGANKFQVFTKLIIPSAFPDFISTMKVNIGLSWVGTIMGEYLVSGSGLGYLIIYGGAVFNLDLVMMSTTILCLCATLMYFSVALLEKKFKNFTK